MNRGALRKTGTGEWNQGIGNIFEESALADGDFVRLDGGGYFRARAVNARGAGGRDLDASFRAEPREERKMVPAEQATGNIVEMNERRAIVVRESSYHAQRRFLMACHEMRSSCDPIELKFEP
jgi:hypothetical protein